MERSSELQIELRDAVEDVRAKSALEPRVALVLGSGLGSFVDAFESRCVIKYADIRGMPDSSVKGHAGNLILGELAGLPLVVMQGRVHLYEGHSAAKVVFGVRLMAKLGADILILTNAAGGIDAGFSVGDYMTLSDQIDLTGTNCLVGPNDPGFGPRFVDMTYAFDSDLRLQARNAAARLGLPMHEGVYAGLRGPAYETPAEIRMLRTLGASAVGMSTVQEVIAARHMGLRCLGISCITNLAAGIGESPLDHEEVQKVARRGRDGFSSLLRRILQGMDLSHIT
ncbi:MAG: purine-nucleoside phosphorylase [Myxococcota bacterium]